MSNVTQKPTTAKTTFNYNTLEKNVLSHSAHGHKIDDLKKLQKVENATILAETLNILKDKANYNTELDGRNVDYLGINHAYTKINSIIMQHDLHKGTEKLLQATCKALLNNSKVDFSQFVKTFKDLDSFNTFSGWVSLKDDVASNEKFLARVSDINIVMGLVSDLTHDNVFMAKDKRKALGAYNVTLEDETEVNLIDLLRNYKINIKNISYDVFNQMLDATKNALKEYYSAN